MRSGGGGGVGRNEGGITRAGGSRAQSTNRVKTQAALSACPLPGTVTNRPTIVP